MDPLSVSASIVSLVGAAQTVAHSLYKYIKAAKGAEKSIANLSKEIINLYGVLNSLHLIASRFESEDLDLSIHERSFQIDQIHACYSTLDVIRSILSKDDPSIAGSKIESARRRLHWPLSESNTKALIDDVGRHRQTLSLALSADTMAALLQSLSLQRDISNGIEDIKNRMIASSLNETRGKVLRWFTQNVNPQKYYFTALRLRHMGTGRWICDDEIFKTWISSNNSKLYLSGIPGAGKTILTATIIEEILTRTRQKGSALAYFFCDYRDPATHDPNNILASLAGQLAAQDEDCYAVAQALFESDNASDGTAASVSIERLCECLHGMMKTLEDAYIVVDALDECANRQPVLEVLHSLNDFENDCVKTLFTGREELDIQTTLHDYEKLSIAANSLDLRRYVDSEITMRSKNGTLRIRDPALQEEIRERLVRKADGMFRWVTCQIDHICALSNDRSRRKALDTLPPDLPTTYERILQRVIASNRENQVIVQRTLRWLLWADYPLSLAALSEAISINVGSQTLDREAIIDPESILRWCGSLVRQTPGADALELAHYSVREFLESIDAHAISSYRMFRSNVEHDNLELAKTCLTYLCLDDFDIDRVEDAEVMRSFLKDYKLLRYCVQHWDMHARVKEDDETLLQLLQGFLSPDRTNQYLAWMCWIASIRAEVYHEDKRKKGKEDVDYGKIGPLLSAMADSSPLHWAAALWLPSTCRWLIKNKCNVNQQSTFFGRPLSTAIKGRDPIAGPPRWLRMSIREQHRQYRYETVKCLLDAGADRNLPDHYLLDKDMKSFQIPSFIFDALRGDAFRVEPDWDIVQLLLDSGVLCDRQSMDCLYNGGPKGFATFQKLEDHNIESSQINYFRQLAIDANVGWDRISGGMTTSKLEVSGSSVFSLFFNAARFGRLQVMGKLISMIADFEGKDINEVDKEGETALGIACRHSHPEIVKALIVGGVNINSVNSLGYTALAIAVGKKSVDCVSLLLQHGADVRATSIDGTTALHEAASHETPRMLEMILEMLLQSSAAKGSSLYTRDNVGWSLLHHAAFHGWLPTIESILEHFEEASPFDRLQDDSTCLHLAARSGRIAGVNFFLGCGLSANDCNKGGETPVYSAIKSFNSFETVQILHTRGADLNFPSGECGDIPLLEVIRRLGRASTADTMSCFDYVLEHTADVNYCDKSGKNCLHWLAESFQELCPYAYIRRVCLALLQRGCSMTRCNAEGYSPFQAFVRRWSHVQSSADHTDQRIWLYSSEWDQNNDLGTALEFEEYAPPIGITLFILKHVKADPGILGTPDSVNLAVEGFSLLSLALRTGDEAAIRQVLEYDGDIDRISSTRDIKPFRTPLEWLCCGKWPKEKYKLNRGLVWDLLSLSQALERKGSTGFAPIHIAADYGNVVVLGELLNMGIDADNLSSGAKSPLMCACESSQLEAMRLLYERGARVAFSERHDSIRTACEKGHKEVLSTLFDMPELKLHWGRTFKFSYRHHRTWTTIDDMTYFHHAAYHSQADVLDWLLEVGLVQGVNSTVGDEKFTALYLAASDERWHPRTISLLLSKGADVSSKCKTSQRTALHVAAMVGNIQSIEVLLAHGADLSATDRNLSTPYLSALEEDELDVASQLLGHMNAKQKEDRCIQVKGKQSPIDDLSMGKALRRFARLGKADIINVLLDNGADINARSRKGTTAVMKASEDGHLEVLDLLKDRGADFAAKDNLGEGALHRACWGNQILVVPGLLELGLTFTDSNLTGWTPLHAYANVQRWIPFNQDFHKVVTAHAIPTQLSSSQLSKLLGGGGRRLPMVEWILSFMDTAQKKNAINNLNYAIPGYALHQASSEGSVEKLEMLLDAGGEIDLRNEKIGPPLACAASMGRMEAVQFLAKQGARFEYSMPDGRKENAIDAAKNYPKVQQWMRTFYKEKEQGLESECGGSDQKALSGIVEGEISEAAGV